MRGMAQHLTSITRRLLGHCDSARIEPPLRRVGTGEPLNATMIALAVIMRTSSRKGAKLISVLAILVAMIPRLEPRPILLG